MRIALGSTDVSVRPTTIHKVELVKVSQGKNTPSPSNYPSPSCDQALHAQDQVRNVRIVLESTAVSVRLATDFRSGGETKYIDKSGTCQGMTGETPPPLKCPLP